MLKRIVGELLSGITAGADFLPYDASDAQVADRAERAAFRVREALSDMLPDENVLAYLERFASKRGVDLPNCKSLSAITRRMTDPAWWRKALKRRFARAEHAFICAGKVHRHAAPYVSNAAMQRAKRHEKKNAKFIADHELTNRDTGEIIPMQDVWNMSLANLANRRAYLMTTIKGIDGFAKSRGFVCYFLTITCPSRMHAYFETGSANPKFGGHSPRRSQAYLGRQVWSNARRKLSREGIESFGVRMVEPHHDGTPHWHILFFAAPDRMKQALSVIQDYALKDSPNEPGAATRRFTAKPIDPEKGAAAYAAKYVAKNIDGFGVDSDNETGKPGQWTAPRVVAWARTHGIKQFQFFGTGALTPFRELGRLDFVPPALEPLIGDLMRAAQHDGEQKADFTAFLVTRREKGIRLTLWNDTRQGSRYPDEESNRIRGVVVHLAGARHCIQTREGDWEIRPTREAVNQRREAAKRVSELVRGDAKHPYLGPASITPRAVDLTGFYSPSNNYRRLNDGSYIDRELVTLRDGEGFEVGTFDHEKERRKTAAFFKNAGYVWSRLEGMWVKASEGEAPCAGNRFQTQGIASRTRL